MMILTLDVVQIAVALTLHRRVQLLLLTRSVRYFCLLLHRHLKRQQVGEVPSQEEAQKVAAELVRGGP